MRYKLYCFNLAYFSMKTVKHIVALFSLTQSPSTGDSSNIWFCSFQHGLSSTSVCGRMTKAMISICLYHLFDIFILRDDDEQFRVCQFFFNGQERTILLVGFSIVMLVTFANLPQTEVPRNLTHARNRQKQYKIFKGGDECSDNKLNFQHKQGINLFQHNAKMICPIIIVQYNSKNKHQLSFSIMLFTVKYYSSYFLNYNMHTQKKTIYVFVCLHVCILVSHTNMYRLNNQ